MIEALRNDFKYMVSYDYDTIYSCEESGCNEEGICRCGHITNTYLNKVDVSAIVTNIYSEIFDNSISTKRNNVINSLWGISSEIQKYTIDRILRVNKIWKPEFWNINVSGGYYGQEIDEVILIEDMVLKINSQLEMAFQIDNLSERVEYLLTIENGFILEKDNVIFLLVLMNKKYINKCYNIYSYWNPKPNMNENIEFFNKDVDYNEYILPFNYTFLIINYSFNLIILQ